MAIKFASGSLSTPEMNVYSLSNFNGVDYTTTPTLVDDTRGIDMSNYLPLGNSLIKRNGWSVVNTFKYNGKTLHIYNIWKFKNYYNKDELSNTKYIIFAGQGADVQQAASTLSLFAVNTLLENAEDYQIKKIFPEGNDVISSELYSYGVLFENRLFILAMNKYLMLYYEKNEELSVGENVVYDLKIDEVKNQAFIPQVIVGLGHKDSQDIAAKVNDFNLLKDECYIELLNYKQTTKEETYIYDIGQFFGDNFKNLDLYKVEDNVFSSILERRNNVHITFGENGNHKNVHYNYINLSGLNIINEDETTSLVSNGAIKLELYTNARVVLQMEENQYDYQYNINGENKYGSSAHFSYIAKEFGKTTIIIDFLSETQIKELYVFNEDVKISGNYYSKDNKYVGQICWNKDTKMLAITKKASNIDEDYVLNYVNLHFKFETNNATIVENMRFGIPYGSSGYRDRLFISGNPDYPNLDIHTNETGLENENWKDYTYFGDMSYRNFGTDAQKITGYGILNNGYMAVFKESSHSLEPNLYIRRSEISADSNGNYVESFPVTLSGVSVGSDAIGQVINYGNDLLINAPKGIYKINTSNSTATQTYEALEMSYSIRDNLNTDISESCSIIFDGKLYITRKDYKGDTRVYVADQDRYFYIDNVRVYEWWVLDGINATKFYIFNNELYFTDAVKGLCKLTEQYYDSYKVDIEDVVVNQVEMSKDVSVNTNTDMLVISPSSEIITTIQNNENVDEGYINLKNSTRITFNKKVEMNIPYDFCEITNINADDYQLKFKNSTNTQFESFLEYFTSTKWLLRKIYKENQVFHNYISKGEYNYVTELEDGELITYLVIPLKLEGVYSLPDTDIDDLIVSIPENTEFDIYELYEQFNEYSLSQCFVDGETWYRNYEDDLGNKYLYEIGTIRDIYFNKLKLKLFNTIVSFEMYDSFQIVDVKFAINQAVSCYWQSKYHSLNRLDYLKTIYSITFVPETKRGGVTNIGYRTTKSEVSFETSAEDQDFNFEFINFNDFSFGGANMAKTYTSKKKIKNFSFIQLKLTSNDTKNSTIVSLSFRYKFTRINKGVK